MLVENSTAESSSSANLFTSVGSNAFVALQSSLSINVSEFELELKALPMKVRASTAAIYRMPLEHWKQMYMKSVSVETDVRIQIGLRTEDNEERQLTLLQIAENAPSNKNGSKKVIEVPLGIESVNQYKKVLMFLHKFQSKHQEKYEHDLVYNQVQTNVDRAAHCVIRDSYKNPDSKSGLRKMFSISFHHHMLLRVQNLRNLNFADCFCTIIPKKQHKEMQQTLALVFNLDKGKTLKEGEVKFACAMCHENIFRCPFGTFAFFMFSLLQVLRGRTSPEKSLTGASQWKTAKKTLADEEIFITRVTYGGRHAGSMEAEGLGIPFDLIKRGGEWKD
ncbi:hypothetical protein PHYBLDRAFT_138811 [Phycomyces blakesleeanus NRRL 1555(-)]|uniref:Uncharacterized protein n=1 Tax=Phycomyces blakesleeanus (strain ATCC 8743b / DSM 1359 / FGSC 10004 / NBRC 33097 / NRRL 1555) TaxID=763407 RepID=A0A163BFI0_PHYB8|nr:hypothetical protein PHYBLDRAFT_138811 [Phycomyces blakesleeanus NRRL 1555(-)]OAD81261.1 hypothetical protein PHYBLDRAFT_138811 [Phycomyces blakesleeanus NRRL 1555(-)]|eukprot:XP_018299301.1 hypothetical protein PHYBLDRAFT_138811 [Phycomyces blakesleeanus NRRL 1555(-)]